MISFPFATKKCRLAVNLPKEYQRRVEFSPMPSQPASFAGLGSWNRSTVVVEVFFQRPGTPLVLWFFLPCLALCLAAWGTLGLAREARAERILASFCLLASHQLLCLGLAASAPPEGAFRPVDVWCCVLTLVHILNFSLHVFVRKDADPASNASRRIVVKPAGGSVMLDGNVKPKTFSRPFLIYRKCFPILILAFNAFYWSATFAWRYS